MKKLLPLLFLSLMIFTLACQKDKMNNDKNPPSNLDYGLGLFQSENLDSIPRAISFGFGDGNLPSQYDITEKLPPIGHQGNYGTCVAWAVGYNAYTALNGINMNYTQAELSNPQYQFSPKHLFTTIPDNLKGSGCDGTQFTVAFDHVQNKGITTMATVPYDNMGNCAQSNSDPSWANEAAKYKLEYWRVIEASVNSIKSNIVKNIPVVFGAKLDDSFMEWSTDDVLTSSSISYDKVGQHAYHAMIISGFDDNKGPNGAFKVTNSWGTGWGNVGYIWIDYNFFLDKFVTTDLTGASNLKDLFIANVAGGENPPDDPDDDRKPNPATGVDLAVWVFGDYSTSAFTGERALQYNLYNIGSQDASPSANHALYYIYYNAYDANDYGILIADEFNESVAPNTFDCPTADKCIINTTIEAGNDLGNKLFNDYGVERQYIVPNITGYYYFLLIADATDVFRENDEMNNYFYTTTWPAWVENGYAMKADKKNDKLLIHNEYNPDGLGLRSNSSFSKPAKHNAYTMEEISALLKAEKKSGRLDRKLNNFKKGNVESYKALSH